MSRDQHRNALRPGHRIQWYEIRRVLGQGGFGITYLAIDTNLDQEVAVKEYLPIELAVRDGDHTVHPASGQHGEQFQWGKDRFISEARTLARFKHPNIVRVFSVFEAMNTAYMVMEYERGESLQDKLAGRRTMDEPELLKIALPIMDGLATVHDAGFIHRDVKPANIFVREDGSPVLLDFGSARQAMGNATKTLTALVSPGYAPFEQYYSKSDEQGPWTDIYGLGATLYRAATGVAPLDAMDRSRSLIESTPDTFIPTGHETGGRYSERFQHAVDHALQFKAADRPQSIAEWRREFGIDDAVAALERRAEEESATTLPTRIVRRKPEPKAARTGGWMAAAAAVVALAAGAYFALPLLVPHEEVAPADTTAGSSASTQAAAPAPDEPPVNSSAATTPVVESVTGATAATAGTVATTAAEPAAGTPITTSAAASAGDSAASDSTAPADENAQRIAALFATAEAEALAKQEEERRRIETQAAQALAAEQQRLADEQTAREAEAQAAREEEQRRAEAQAAQAREAEQQRLAAEQAARELQAQQAAAADEATRLALAKPQAEACKATSGTPAAEPARAGSGTYFAAIAVGGANGWGEAWGYETRGDAEQVALAGCQQNDTGCAVQVWSNDCVAFATGPKGAAGWSWGTSINDARQKALGFCESNGACCTLMTAYCADELGQ